MLFLLLCSFHLCLRELVFFLIELILEAFTNVMFSTTRISAQKSMQEKYKTYFPTLFY